MRLTDSQIQGVPEAVTRGAAAVPRPCLLKVADVAHRFCVSPRTVQRWAREGQLPAVRMSSRTLRFDPDQVDQALARMGCGHPTAR